MGDLLVRGFLKFVEDHPEQIERLIAAAVAALTDHLEQRRSAPAPLTTRPAV